MNLHKLAEKARRVSSLFRTRALVLLYHRVAHVPLDPWSMAVTPERFADHMEILRRHCRPVPLGDLVRSAAEGKVVPRSVAVTFDDGYADNLHTVTPLLERHEIPATIFVSSGASDDPQVFWWDVLQRLVLPPGRLPAELTIDLDGVMRQWRLGPAAEFSEEDAGASSTWRWSEPPPHPRLAFFRELWDHLRTLNPQARGAVLDQLSSWSGREIDAPEAERALRREEVRRLAAHGIVDIGAHTVTHARLGSLDRDDQVREIVQSKATLEAILDAPISNFAYPHGSRSDYSRETVRIVRDAGFRCACAAWFGSVDSRTDPYQVPRIYVENWDAERFTRTVSSWIGAKIP